MSELLPVHDLIRHSDGIFEIQFVRGGLEFTPGDCLALFGEDRKTSRPYSVASGTGEDILRFIVRKMTGGIVTEYLSGRRPGDEVKASPPFGWFRPGPGEDHAPFIYVATGTGIAPFLSQLRSDPDSRPLRCLYGVRRAADAVEVDWLRRVCDLRLAISREAVAGCHHGRVTGLLADLPSAPGVHYYLCGLDAMIDEVTTWLEHRGTPITHIHRECFFNSSYDAPAPESAQ